MGYLYRARGTGIKRGLIDALSFAGGQMNLLPMKHRAATICVCQPEPPVLGALCSFAEGVYSGHQGHEAALTLKKRPSDSSRLHSRALVESYRGTLRHRRLGSRQEPELVQCFLCSNTV